MTFSGKNSNVIWQQTSVRNISWYFKVEVNGRHKEIARKCERDTSLHGICRPGTLLCISCAMQVFNLWQFPQSLRLQLSVRLHPFDRRQNSQIPARSYTYFYNKIVKYSTQVTLLVTRISSSCVDRTL